MSGLNFWKYVLPYLILILISLCFYSFFLNKGITLYDEGYIVEASYLVYLGKIPYKDFFFPYTPLTIWLGAAVFKIAGIGILKLRLLALLASISNVLVGYWIIKKIAGIKIAILSSLAILVWCFPQTNFLWPSSLAILPFFISLFFLLKWVEKKQKNFALLTGISVALTILTKQNLGASLLLMLLLFQLYLNKKAGFHLNIRPFFVGLIIILVPIGLILIISNPNFEGFGELALRSLNAASGKILSTKYPSIVLPLGSTAENLKSVAKSLLYYSPFLLILAALASSIKRVRIKPDVLAVLLLSITFSLTVIWPTIDLAHFSFGVPALILAFASLSKISGRTTRLFSFCYILFFIFVGFYKTFFMSYYTFETPYLKLQKNIYIRGEKIVVDEKHAEIINQLDKYKHTLLVNKTVFVHSYAPMIYFILDKIPPVPDLYTQDGIISETSIHSDIEKLNKSKPDFVIVEKWRETDSEITRFIKNNYIPVTTIWDFEISERKH